MGPVDIPRLVLESMPTWLALVLLAVNTAVGLVALGIVPHGRRPAAGWAWLVVIVAFPLWGILAYLLLGRAKLPAERTRRQRAATSLVSRPGRPVTRTCNPSVSWETCQLATAEDSRTPYYKDLRFAKKGWDEFLRSYMRSATA